MKPIFTVLLIACASALGGCGASPTATSSEVPESNAKQIGLVSSLPIYWPEAGGVDEMLAGNQATPWVRSLLEERYEIVPLDTLTDIGRAENTDETGQSGEENAVTQSSALARLDRLIIAQPRALTPADNVALDEWVRGGGQLLLMLDPRLTRHSRFAYGDPRRPADMALLNQPILARWGLAANAGPEPNAAHDHAHDGHASGNENAASGASVVPPDLPHVMLGMTPMPIALPARVSLDTSRIGPDAKCRISAQGRDGHCHIGKGRAVLFFDAAIIESECAARRRCEGFASLA